MSDPVGIRELKNSLSEVLRRVKRGEHVEIHDRGHPVAMIVPFETDPRERMAHLAALGAITWNGKKPLGSADPPRITGRSVADAVVEDRR
jgi:prevent-host-death family protein